MTTRFFLVLLFTSLLGLGSMPIWAQEADAEPAEEETSEQAPADVDMEIRGRSGGKDNTLYGEPVRRIFAPQVSNWHILDNKRLLLYASRSRPYLVTLSHPAHGLRGSSTIGLRRRGTSIDARFDDIIVDGFTYRIERIEKLDVNVAKRLRGIEVPEDDQEKDAGDESGDQGSGDSSSGSGSADRQGTHR